MGLCYNIAFVFLYEKIYPEKCEINAVFEIIDIEEKEKSNKYIIKTVKNNYIRNSKNTKLILYSNKSEKFAIGDVVEIYGNFEKANVSRNYKGFNYRNYLKFKRIYGIINSEKIILMGKRTTFDVIIGNLRNNLKNRIDTLYNNNYADFLNGILLGKTENIDLNIIENFRNTNISHILAISGLHISYVIIGIKFILNKIIKDIKKQNIIIIFLLFLFTFLTGFSMSCLRACIMNSLILLSFNLNRKSNFYINLFLSFIIIIFINPFNIYNVGMWLSFSTTLSIVLFYKFFYRICEIKLLIKQKNKKIYSKILKVVLISVSAQILMLPITIYEFNTFSTNFIISNFLISFVIGPILILGYITIFLSYIKSPFIKIFICIEELLIFIILKISEILGNIPFSKIYVKTPYFTSVLLFYIIIFIFVFLFKKKKYFILKMILSKKYFSSIIRKEINNLKNKIYKNLKKYKLNTKKIIFLILIIITFSQFLIKNQNFKFYFIDVGQGDSSLIITPKGKNILIDGGEGNSDKYDYGKNVVLPYLLDRRIKNIDYLIISHADSDHIGGTFAVLENLNVKKILLGIQYENSKQLEDLLKEAKNKKIEIIYLKTGDKIKIEKNVYIDVVWPSDKEIKDNILNNNSLVLKVKYKKFSILFTGDIEELAEKEILNYYNNNLEILKSDIIKVAHHGSKTSSTENFLKIVSPKIALIGVGKNNNFGHPSSEVIDRLKKICDKILRTDENGEIDIEIDDKIKIKKTF